MGKLPDYLNVKKFNSPNKMTLLWGNTDNLFHFTDDFSFFRRKYKQTIGPIKYCGHSSNLFIKMTVIIYHGYYIFYCSKLVKNIIERHIIRGAFFLILTLIRVTKKRIILLEKKSHRK